MEQDIGETTPFQDLLRACETVVSEGDDAWWVMPVGERLAVALTLNRCDLLAQNNTTLSEAIIQARPEWIESIPAVTVKFSRRFFAI